jgi:hypothetical protein
MMRYTCSNCGAEKQDGEAWLGLRVAADRRGVEIRTFINCGPDDQLFCSEGCAFQRVSEVLGGPIPPKE